MANRAPSWSKLLALASATKLIGGLILVALSPLIPWEPFLSIPEHNAYHESLFDHQRQYVCAGFLLIVGVLAGGLSLPTVLLTRKPRRLLIAVLLLALSTLTVFRGLLMDPGAR